MRAATLRAVLEAADAGGALVVATDIASGEERIVDLGREGPDDEIARAAHAALADDQSRLVATGDGREIFLRVFAGPRTVYVLGAVHIAQALGPMARLLGYRVVIVDPRSAFATSERFPGVEIVPDWPDEAALKLDARSAVVTLTHDPKLDDEALDRALRSPVFYIAALGSRRTHAARLERLRRRGHDEAALARIHGPAGLAIGAKGAGEIALSILAELTAARRLPAPVAAAVPVP